MAIALTSATPAAINTSTDSQGFLTSNWTPTTGAVVFAFVGNSKAAAPDTVTVTGNGLTWSTITTIKTPTDTIRITALSGYAASPSFGSTNFQFGADQTGCFVRLAEFTGVKTSGSVVRSATTATNTGSNSTALRMTLSGTPASGNFWMGGIGSNLATWNTNLSDNTLTAANYASPGCGWLTSYNSAPSGTLEDFYHASNIVADSGIVFEIAAATGGGAPVSSSIVGSNTVGSMLVG